MMISSHHKTGYEENIDNMRNSIIKMMDAEVWCPSFLLQPDINIKVILSIVYVSSIMSVQCFTVVVSGFNHSLVTTSHWQLLESRVAACWGGSVPTDMLRWLVHPECFLLKVYQAPARAELVTHMSRMFDYDWHWKRSWKVWCSEWWRIYCFTVVSASYSSQPVTFCAADLHIHLLPVCRTWFVIGSSQIAIIYCLQFK